MKNLLSMFTLALFVQTVSGQAVRDCNNVLGGTARLDACGTCSGGTTGRNACKTLADGTYTIKALHSGMCIQTGTAVSQQACAAKNDQIWKLTKVGNFYQIQNSATNQYLTYNQATPVAIFDGVTMNGWTQTPANSWQVKTNLLASRGTGTGDIKTTGLYSNYRVTFSHKHTVTDLAALVKDHSNTDHYAAALIFGNPPPAALQGLQFGLPTGRHFDYRTRTYADNLFTIPNKPPFAYDPWSRVEILVDSKTGTARMAVAQPIGSKAIEVLVFKDITAGKPSPFAYEMHNAGLFDEYKDIAIEIDPAVNDLITTKAADNPILNNKLVSSPALTNNLWRLEDAGSGNYTLVASAHIGAVADVSAGATTAGSGLALFTRTANNNQKFTFTPANVTAVEDELANSQIQLYPNPFQKEVNITAQGNFQYTIYDMNGNVMESHTAQQSVKTGMDLLPGTYMVKIQSGSTEKTLKIQKAE